MCGVVRTRDRTHSHDTDYTTGKTMIRSQYRSHRTLHRSGVWGDSLIESEHLLSPACDPCFTGRTGAPGPSAQASAWRAGTVAFPLASLLLGGRPKPRASVRVRDPASVVERDGLDRRLSWRLGPHTSLRCVTRKTLSCPPACSCATAASTWVLPASASQVTPTNRSCSSASDSRPMRSRSSARASTTAGSWREHERAVVLT